MFFIEKEFTFDAAHRLGHLGPNHKCGRLHGHTYRVSVKLVAVRLDPVNGWIVDFGELSKLVKPLIEQLDHHYIAGTHDQDLVAALRPEEVCHLLPGLPSTAENMARVIGRQLFHNATASGNPVKDVLDSVTVWETPTASATWQYDGETWVEAR